MAIGPDGKVTTTGLMDAGMKTPDAPDMSNLKPPAQAQEKTAPAAAMPYTTIPCTTMPSTAMPSAMHCHTMPCSALWCDARQHPHETLMRPS